MALARAQAVELARRLVVEGASLAEAADQSGIPLSTLEKTSAREGWFKARETRATYAARFRQAKDLALDRYLEIVQRPNVTADELIKSAAVLRSVEAAFPEHRYTPQADPKLRLELSVQLVEELVAYLGDEEHGDRVALAAIQPHLVPFVKHLEAAHGRQ